MHSVHTVTEATAASCLRHQLGSLAVLLLLAGCDAAVVPGVITL
jgi:hypothetical protein